MGGDPTLDTKFSLLNNGTEKPALDYIWTIYTGKNNSEKTREFKQVFGNKNDEV